MMAAMDGTLVGPRVTLRSIERRDRSRLRDILGEPEVARWWAPRGPDHAVDGLFDVDEVVFVIESDGGVVGAIEYYEEDDADYRHASIDIFLDTVHQGLGLGREAIAILAHYLFDERGHHRLTIDPALSNERAIRAYRRVGFRPGGVLRQYERGPDGTWHDGLLMDLLAGELT